MRSFIFILSLILSTLLFVIDTYGQSSSDGVTVNIVFHPIQTITVNSSQKNVELQYLTKEDYNEGVVATLDDHLTVTSTGGFQVNVSSVQEDFTLSGSGESISVSDLSIRAINGTDNNLTQIFDNVILSTRPESIIKSGIGGVNLKYNVTYDNTAGASDKYVNLNLGNSEAIFSTEITYTITSK